DATPAGDLLVGDDAGLADEGLRFEVHIGSLGDDQADTRPLTVVLDDQISGYTGRTTTHAGQRGHDDTVREFEVSEGNRCEQIHGWRNHPHPRLHSGARPIVGWVIAPGDWSPRVFGGGDQPIRPVLQMLDELRR